MKLQPIGADFADDRDNIGRYDPTAPHGQLVGRWRHEREHRVERRNALHLWRCGDYRVCENVNLGEAWESDPVEVDENFHSWAFELTVEVKGIEHFVATAWTKDQAQRIAKAHVKLGGDQ